VLDGQTRAVSGRLEVRLDISKSGEVERVNVVRSLDPEIDRTVVELLKQWRFEPATRCGEPVPGSYTLGLRFEG
jgi:protein TonB